MSILNDILKNQLSGDVLEKIARTSGVSSTDAKKLAKTTFPVLLGTLNKNTNTKNGAQELAKTLAKNHGGELLGNLSDVIGSNNLKKDGAKILDHMFQKKKNKIIAEVGKKVGLDARNSQKIVEQLAPILLENVGRIQKEKKLDVKGLSDMLTKEARKEKVLDGSFLKNILDKDKDGNIVDDLLGFSKKVRK